MDPRGRYMLFNFSMERLTESLAKVNALNAIRSGVDILIVAYVIYKLLVFIR